MGDSEAPFSPDAALPQNPEFYYRVLHHLPSPVLVVDRLGTIVYGNLAAARMGGWDLISQIGSNVLDYVDASYSEQVTAAFFELVDSEQSNQPDVVYWAPINTFMVTLDGQSVPVIVTGSGHLDDPEVQGIVYDIRPAFEQDILRRGLAGLAHGEPIDSILELITDMISLPPLRLDAAVLEPRGDGTYRVIGATAEALESILGGASDPQPWNTHHDEPKRTLVSEYSGPVGEELFAAGYREFWHTCPDVDDDHHYRIVAAGPVVQTPAGGQMDRLSSATELASVVLLRARADAMLEHSATHDDLTALPNREGFRREAVELIAQSDADEVALLFIDLDGFKAVNDAHGHAAGDHVLETVAYRLVSVTRSIDLIARLGGDEFVVLVGSTKNRPVSKSRVRAIADRALAEINEPIDVGRASVTIAASIGAIVAPTPIELDDLLRQADAAMYEAKRNGGSRHHINALVAPTDIDPS